MEKIRGELTEIEIPQEVPSETELPPVAPRKNLQKFFRSQLPGFSESTGFYGGSRSGGVGYSLIAWSLLAALIDGLILFSLGCFFLFAFSVLVKVQLLSVVGFFKSSIFKVGVLGMLSLVGTYMIMLRVFLGFTIGEWACGLRLGNLKQRLNRFYSLRVVARMSLILITGLVFLPALSLLFGKDVPGLLVRLSLISLEKEK